MADDALVVMVNDDLIIPMLIPVTSPPWSEPPFNRARSSPYPRQGAIFHRTTRQGPRTTATAPISCLVGDLCALPLMGATMTASGKLRTWYNSHSKRAVEMCRPLSGLLRLKAKRLGGDLEPVVVIDFETTGASPHPASPRLRSPRCGCMRGASRPASCSSPGSVLPWSERSHRRDK